MLTIGELASYVGVTPRAVRFYHQRGLMPEPERDASGYRRYGADDVIRLTRIAALAGAGVPLARIAELLEAGDEEFARGLAAIDADVRAQLRRLREVRATLRELGSADRLALPPMMADLVVDLRSSGADPERVDQYRDGWILNRVLYPGAMDYWLADGAAGMLTDPSYFSMLVDTMRVADLDPGDPEVEALAQRSAAWIIENWEVQSQAFDLDQTDATKNRLLDGHWRSTPAWDHLSARIVTLLRAHGLDRPEFDGVPSAEAEAEAEG